MAEVVLDGITMDNDLRGYPRPAPVRIEIVNPKRWSDFVGVDMQARDRIVQLEERVAELEKIIERLNE